MLFCFPQLSETFVFLFLHCGVIVYVRVNGVHIDHFRYLKMSRWCLCGEQVNLWRERRWRNRFDCHSFVLRDWWGRHKAHVVSKLITEWGGGGWKCCYVYPPLRRGYYIWVCLFVNLAEIFGKIMSVGKLVCWFFCLYCCGSGSHEHTTYRFHLVSCVDKCLFSDSSPSIV